MRFNHFSRHRCKTLPTPLPSARRKSGNLILMTRALLYCFPNCAQRRSKLQKEPAKFQESRSSILSSKSPESFVAWVCVHRSIINYSVTSPIGCHTLALDVVRSWSFERPSAASRVAVALPPSPKMSRMVSMDHFLHRRSSILIDINVEAQTPSGQRTPQYPQHTKVEEPDFVARKAGLGSLMRSAKLDAQVAEFDINTWF